MKVGRLARRHEPGERHVPRLAARTKSKRRDEERARMTDPKALYSACEAREKKMNDERLWKAFKLDIVQRLTFPPLPPLFIERAAGAVVSDVNSSEANLAKLKKAVYQGTQYREIVELLKNCPDNESRFLLLARWLKQESVCEPKDFLPRQVFQTLTRQARQRAKAISLTDWRYFFVINAWKPYFESQIADLRRIEKADRRVKEGLLKMGYEEQAVVLVMPKRKRSVVPAVCEWLEARGIAEAVARL